MQSKLVASSTDNDRLPQTWTRTHSFYANMGGFAFDFVESDPMADEAFTKKHSRLTVTPRGMALLAQCGLLPEISRADILDKNKADNVSKLLAILQALWMLAQILGRLIVHLPITLLEVNTLAHIVCALLIYALWWYKPKLINEPTKLRGDWVAPVAAYMYMSSQVSGWKSARPGILKKTWIDPELSILAFRTSQRADPKLDRMGLTRNPSAGSTTHETASVPRLPSTTACGSFFPRPIVMSKEEKRKGSITSSLSLTQSRLESTQEMQSNRWALAAEAMTLHPAIAARVTPQESFEDNSRQIWFKPVTEELVDVSVGNGATEKLLHDMTGFVVGITMWTVSMAYGCMHAAAWDSYFPSRTESLMWRGSSVVIAGSGLIWILINLFGRSFNRVNAYWRSVATLQVDCLSLIALGSLASCCGLLYLAARIFLVLEAFISLRKLPGSAFDTLEWTQLIPHL